MLHSILIALIVAWLPFASFAEDAKKADKSAVEKSADTPAAKPKQKPQMLMVDEVRGVDPACILSFLSDNPKRTEMIDVPTCERQPITVDFSPMYHAVGEGFVGYDYRYNEHPEDGPYYISYKVLGKMAEDIYLLIIKNGGPQGDFSTLLTLKYGVTSIALDQEIVTGNRCQGGIKEAVLTDSKIGYSASYTPYALMKLANREMSIDPDHDLSNADDACIATVTFFDGNPVLVKPAETLELAKVTDVKKLKHQACFNKLIKPSLKSAMAFADVQELASKFESTCLKPTAKKK